MENQRVCASSRVLKLELSIVRALCESTDTPRSLAVHLLIRYEEWAQLMALQCDHSHYNDIDRFTLDYQVTEALKKNPRVPLNVDRRAVAIKKFEEAEALCAQTNLRLASIDSFPSEMIKVQHHAASIISGILGPLTRSDLEFCESQMSFGPGSTTSVSGVVTRGRKFSSRVLHATPRVVDFGLHCLPAAWRRDVRGFDLRTYSKLTTVPKNAKTDRVICVEPDLNIFVQLGTGKLIRDKLRRSGLDLSSGQEVNRFMASKAVDWDLTTMDLSSASDLISREVVWLLLPDRWAELLWFSRVDKTQDSTTGKLYDLEKWSSMGNGYTFELETLLFWGIVRGCLRHLGLSEKLAVAYGDDLIFPSSALDLVTRALEFFGFRVNSEKTFGTGLFRESCGTDWFMGSDVRPFFLKAETNDLTSACYIYSNAITRVASRSYDQLARDSRFLPAWLRCFSAVSPSDRHRIPLGYGDEGFQSSFDEACPLVGRSKSGWQGYSFPIRRIGTVDTNEFEAGLYTSTLHQGRMSELPSYGREAMRGRTRPPVRRRGHVFAWPHLGAWV